MNIDPLISVVVCSINKKYFGTFEKNIAETIGCEYELIKVDNSINPRGICEVYNRALEQAKGGIICYCHEDISFETNGWGKEILSVLKHEEIGLVGIAGSIYKSKYPTSWVNVPQAYYRANIKQEQQDGNFLYTKILDEGEYSEVAVLDGCFIAGRKEIFNLYQWNETQLKGFHLYDLDISIRVMKHFKLAVANNITILHLSSGNFDATWLNESIQYHAINKAAFPVTVSEIEREDIKKLDYYGLTILLQMFNNNNQPFSVKFNFALKAILKFPFKKNNINLLKSVFNN